MPRAQGMGAELSPGRARSLRRRVRLIRRRVRLIRRRVRLNTAMGSDSLGAAAGLRGICWGCALRLRKSAKGTKCARARHLFVPLVIGRAHARFWARNEERRRRRPEPRRIPAMLGIIVILDYLSRGGPTAARRAI